MSRRNKLQKFADLLSYPNVYENFSHKDPQLIGQNGVPVDLKGKWGELHFKNDHPITLELACGRGEYTLGLSRMFPQRNFIGVDIKGARIWKGAGIALKENIPNAAFLRTRIEQLHLFFEPQEVEDIWITFPDPFLKKDNRKLTGSRFLDAYRKILPPQGIIHLKTDSEELYEFSVETAQQYPHINIVVAEDDIYSKPLIMPELDLKTYYENMHLRDGRTIKYLRLQFQA